jgi:hypothetical protein
MKTAMQELMDELDDIVTKSTKKKWIEKEKEQMLNFYMWMRMNESAEKYFHYTDEDMFAEYLKQISYDN